MMRLLNFKGSMLVTVLKLWLVILATSITAVSAEEILDKRIEAERQSHENPFIITQHRANYILP